MHAANPIVTIAELTRVHGSGASRIQALRGINFAVEPAEVFALLGPNRAGKTTLVKVLLGLCRASGGTVTRLGRPLAERATLARVGYMHENQAFPRYLTATQILQFYGKMTWLSQAALRKRVPALLERVCLADYRQGDVLQHLGPDAEADAVTCNVGLATAAALSGSRSQRSSPRRDGFRGSKAPISRGR